jgi:hypothetical protein
VGGGKEGGVRSLGTLESMVMEEVGQEAVPWELLLAEKHLKRLLLF